MSRAVDVAVEVARELGLDVRDAVVLQASNKVSVRLLPCDVLARVAPPGDRIGGFEVEVAGRLAAAGCPVARLDPRVEPRVHERDGYEVTLWTYYERVGENAPEAYAAALGRLHAGMWGIDVPAPHYAERVAEARRLVGDRERTPRLAAADRELLVERLRVPSGVTAEQLLHGEPHPGNVLATEFGPLFIDFETVCRGPVEFDLAHAPEEVGVSYPGADPELLRECRGLVLAIITAWRWDRADRLPDGRRLGEEWLASLRRAESAAG